VLFNVGIALQALEARDTSRSLSLRVGLLAPLLQRPLWVLGLVLGLVGVAPQVAAFAWAPFALVQTLVAAGLVLLLAIAARRLGERVTASAVAGVALIVAGVALVSWGAPSHVETHRGGLAVVAVAAVVGVASLVPFALRRTALAGGIALAVAGGIGFADTNIATKLLSDNVGRGHWWNAVAWTAVAAAFGVTATIALMTAFQRCAATVVVPVSTAVQTFLPILLEPLFLRESFASAPLDGAPLLAGCVVALAGVVLVARVPAVSKLAAGG